MSADAIPARLLLVDGVVVDGTYHDEPATFVSPARPGKCFAVYSKRADGTLLLRRDHYKPITRNGIELFFSAELGRFVTIPED